MHQDVPPCQLLLNQFVKLGKIFGDIFGFHVQQGVDDVVDGAVVLNVVHAHRGCDNCIDDDIPVWICYLLMNSRSKAEDISPRKIDFPDY